PDIIGGGYGRFWNDTSRYRVLKGGKGSKKSSTTALNYIYRLMKYKDSNLLVVRAVANTHRDSTFAQLKWAINRLGVGHLWKCSVSPLEIVYIPTGQKILFRGFDDVLKLASTTVERDIFAGCGSRRHMSCRMKAILISSICRCREATYRALSLSRRL
ncbi:MAG: phage terminase large subunit, partial [Acutalibacteraceae bacterium]